MSQPRRRFLFQSEKGVVVLDLNYSCMMYASCEFVVRGMVQRSVWLGRVLRLKVQPSGLLLSVPSTFFTFIVTVAILVFQCSLFIIEKLTLD